MPRTVTLVHFDTCLSDYVANHMNGDREALLSATVDGSTTYREVKAELTSALRHNEFYGKQDLPDVPALLAALEDTFADVVNLDAVAQPDLEPASDDDDMGSVCMWFRLSWEPAE